MPARQSFLFADLSGFTAMTEVHGDEEAADLAGEFVKAVRRLLEAHGAEEIKRIGDAVMIRCPDAAQAVALAVRIVNEVGETHGFPVVRVGMNTGPAVEREGDWFGNTVNVAARVAGLAAGGEVLLTGTTKDAAGKMGSIQMAPRGRRKLRNVSEPIQLFAAIAEGGTNERGLPIDPVCRMAVDRAHSAGRMHFREITYFFCSFECAQAFTHQPERFIGAASPPSEES